MSKMLSACLVPSKFWGVFFGERVFFSSFLNFQQKIWSSLAKVFWARFWSWVSRVQNNQHFVRIRRWKKRNFSLVHRQWVEKVSDGSVIFQRGLSNLLFKCPVEQFRGKIPVFVFHEFQTLGKYPSNIWWNESDKVAETVIHVSGGNFLGESCKKVSRLFLLFQTVSKNDLPICVFLASLPKTLFTYRHGNCMIFSWKNCVFPIIPDLEWKPWNSLANYSDNFVKIAFYVPVHFFVKKNFF